MFIFNYFQQIKQGDRHITGLHSYSEGLAVENLQKGTAGAHPRATGLPGPASNVCMRGKVPATSASLPSPKDVALLP